MRSLVPLALAALLLPAPALAQAFYFGNDLSYVNQMEDCGADFKDGGVSKEVYQIFADRGANLVSLRLWVDPSWWQSPLQQPEGVKPFYNDLTDVTEAIERSKAAGMEVMLGFQYSDFWADPGRQLIPNAWLGVANDVAALADSVYDYTVRVLTSLDERGLMPELVKVGNEVTSGILRHTANPGNFEPDATVSDSWTRHATLLNAGIRAVRDVGATASIDPKIVIHFASDLQGQLWNFRNVMENGVTDFDVIGISYYYAWHGGSIDQLETTVRALGREFAGYEVMVVETAYPWTTRNHDSLGNIVTDPDPAYLPISRGKQLEYLTDYARAVMRGGGSGVVFWEPAWVSTPCRTPWGQGSSHDHLAYFEPGTNDFIENGGGRWMESAFYEDLSARKVSFEVDMSGQDVDGGVYLTGRFGDATETFPMWDEGGGIFSYYMYLPDGSTGTFRFVRGGGAEGGENVPEACAAASGDARSYTVSEDAAVFAYEWASCDVIGTSSGSVDRPDRSYELHPNYPNPFRTATTIAYHIPHPAQVTLTIYDGLGRVVSSLVDGARSAGLHEVRFEAANLPAGLYFCRFETQTFSETGLLALVR